MKNILRCVKVALCSLLMMIVSNAIAQDITAAGGTLTVFQENDGGSDAAEGSPQVIDNNVSTKFLSHWPGSQWIQLALNGPAAVNTYTLTSANDAPDRDPLAWTLEGSDDGSTWTTLDTRTGETFSSRIQTKVYSFTNATAYTYYRLNISAINGGGTFQMGEWRLYRVTPVEDVTAAGGTLTVLQENDGGAAAAEGSPHVIDNDVTTKFLSHFPESQWIQLALNAPAVVATYTLTSGNDAPGRDPLDWTLEASNDGSTWTVLDTRTGEKFSGRIQTKAYHFENSNAYGYYRLNISALNGSGTFQMGEWRLYKKGVPAVPADFNALSTAGDEVYLTWADNVTTGEGFVLERSVDGETYKAIADLNATVTSFYDRGLNYNTLYFYRIRSYNMHGSSPYVKILNVRTLDYSGGFVDVTDNGGSLTVSDENTNDAENSAKFIDNNISTKFLAPANAFWVQYESAATDVVVTKYSIVSGNDSQKFPDRDPKAWTFEGSNDGVSWDVLDTQTNQRFASDFLETTYAFENNTAYRFYKIDFTENNGSGGTQMSEWHIWGIPVNAPEVPGDLRITEVTESSITLNWNDDATNESGYEIEASTDGTNFYPVETTSAGSTEFTDNELRVLTTYYYRVRATGASGNSIFSQIVSETTLYDEQLPLPAENLTATALSETEVVLTWTDRADNETGYEIERSTNNSDFFVNIATVGAEVTTFNDVDRKLATKYFYRVRPFNAYSQESVNDAPFTDVAEVVTPGSNQPPTMDPIANQMSCNVSDVNTILIEGLTAGAEEGQQLQLAVVTASPDMFSELSVTEVVDGKANLNYKLVEGQTGDAVVTVTVQDDGGTLNGGEDSFSRDFLITVYELEVGISPDYTTEKVSRGQVITLTASGEGNYTYSWAEGPGIISGQNDNVLTLKPTQGYIYKVTASTDDGCKKEAEFTVQMEGSVHLQANNILTPNGDGKNDVWVIWNINTYPGSTVKVLDASGRVVFEQENYTNDWDGTFRGSLLAEGTYFYVFDLGSGIPAVKGALTIIRQ